MRRWRPAIWLVAGGVGLAPLLWFAEKYPRAQHQLIYGARTAEDLVLLDDIRATGCGIVLTTEDGSAPAGVTSSAAASPTRSRTLLPRRSAPGARVFTCGPNAMMRAVVEQARAHDVPCLVSVEGEMACGIGVCLGCALPLDARARGRSPTPASTGRCSTRRKVVIP